MTHFKELLEMDGGNAGEYNQAKKEQKEMDDARSKGKDAQEIAGKCMQLLYRLTGKKWPYQGTATRYGYMENQQSAMLKNPGRLKAWKEIKKEFSMKKYEEELANALGAKETGGIPMNYKLGSIKFQMAFVGSSRDLEIFVP